MDYHLFRCQHFMAAVSFGICRAICIHSENNGFYEEHFHQQGADQLLYFAGEHFPSESFPPFRAGKFNPGILAASFYRCGVFAVPGSGKQLQNPGKELPADTVWRDCMLSLGFSLYQFGIRLCIL